jgi:tRNA uridine 5-carboxymethylaminomethyl modification enzyme
LAGLNAIRKTRGEEPVVLNREEAYMGVLIDDLVTRGVDEPYRLFTSRAEYRLLLRQDNALTRLGKLASVTGLLTEKEKETLERRLAEAAEVESLARNTVARPAQVNEVLRNTGENEIDEAQRVSDLVRRPSLKLRELLSSTVDELPNVQEDVWTSAEIELKYAGYLDRERRTVEQVKEMASFRLPDQMEYLKMKSVSTEARQKLNAIRPQSLAQAGRIPGVSPSDLQNLVVEVLRHRDRPTDN